MIFPISFTLMTIRIKRDVKAWYRDLAASRGVKLSTIVRDALDDWRFSQQVQRAQSWEGEATPVETS